MLPTFLINFLPVSLQIAPWHHEQAAHLPRHDFFTVDPPADSLVRNAEPRSDSFDTQRSLVIRQHVLRLAHKRNPLDFPFCQQLSDINPRGLQSRKDFVSRDSLDRKSTRLNSSH